MATLAGTPSDDVSGVISAGNGDVTTLFVSMSARHPEGQDADYLAWHSLDHRAEQHRLPALRASLRLVSTSACRAARAASDERYDAVDHVMSYFFADVSGLHGFEALSIALRDAGRIPYLLPTVERGVYSIEGKVAAPRIKIGADVLPWWPSRGIYVLIERGEVPPPQDLTEVAGVAGAWWAAGLPVWPPHQTGDNAGLQITYCYLDDEPVETAGRLRPLLEKRWADSTVAPLLAAPFWTVVAHEWGRSLP